jgi:hypothetical protein
MGCDKYKANYHKQIVEKDINDPKHYWFFSAICWQYAKLCKGINKNTQKLVTLLKLTRAVQKDSCSF